MNTEKSIKLLKVVKEILPEHYNFDFGKEEIDEIIKRLQMWEDFKKRGFNESFLKLNDDCTISKFKIDPYMDNFEQEYFQKPKIRKTIEVDVLASNKEVINELEKEIDEMNGRIFDKGKIRVVSTRWKRD